MHNRTRVTADRALLIAFSIPISMSIIAIAWMLLAAVAFANAMTIEIPFLVRFDGFQEAGGSNAVTVNGSWVGAVVLVLLFALPLWIFALRYRRATD